MWEAIRQGRCDATDVAMFYDRCLESSAPLWVIEVAAECFDNAKHSAEEHFRPVCFISSILMQKMREWLTQK